jgi:hypothetical protein
VAVVLPSGREEYPVPVIPAMVEPPTICALVGTPVMEEKYPTPGKLVERFQAPRLGIVPVRVAPVPSIAWRPSKIFAADAGLSRLEVVVLSFGEQEVARIAPAQAKKKTNLE